MTIYLAINIHRGILSSVKGFRDEHGRDAFADEWARENGFKNYDEYEQEEYTGEMDNCLYLDEVEIS